MAATLLQPGQALSEKLAHQSGKNPFFLGGRIVAEPPEFIVALVPVVPFLHRWNGYTIEHEGQEPGHGRAVERPAEQVAAFLLCGAVQALEKNQRIAVLIPRPEHGIIQQGCLAEQSSQGFQNVAPFYIEAEQGIRHAPVAHIDRLIQGALPYVAINICLIPMPYSTLQTHKIALVASPCASLGQHRHQVAVIAIDRLEGVPPFFYETSGVCRIEHDHIISCDPPVRKPISARAPEDFVKNGNISFGVGPLCSTNWTLSG